ncbi:sensor histidine kinase [Geodermatophilus sp. SYSU D00691]
MRAVRWTLVLVGGAALVGALVWDVVRGDPGHVVWLMLGPAPFFLVGLLALRPETRALQWLLAAGTFFALDVLLGDLVLPAVHGTAAAPTVALVRDLVGLVSVGAAVGMVALYPSGRVEGRLERWVLGALLAASALVPLATALSRPTLPVGLYDDPGTPPVPSPLHVPALAPAAPVVDVLRATWLGWVLVAVVLLARRYHHAAPPVRRQTRLVLISWAAAFGLVWLPSVVVLRFAPEGVLTTVVVGVLWFGTLVLALGAQVVPLVSDGVLGIDAPARRRAVRRALGALIMLTLAGVAVAAGLVLARVAGPVAGVVGAVAVALGCLPLRRRAEVAVDRWVLGSRLDGYTLLSRFGDALARVTGPQQLLDELATTVWRGLDLTWVTVRLEPEGTEAAAGLPAERRGAPDVVVPMRLGAATLGSISCGPRRDGPLLPEDRRSLGYLAGQAAAVVHALHLTAQLSRQAGELAASRHRVVAGQDAERRRIQRDLHDGVQQEVVAVSAKVSLARQRLQRGDPGVEGVLTELQQDVGALLREVREVAHAIHPPVLADQGLLEAVEAQATRLPLAVRVRADPALRAGRLPAQVETTAWYGVAEALSNVVKYADAEQVVVSLQRPDGHLRVVVEDDGRGFAPDRPRGLGLAGLADRLDVLGGTLTVRSAPGAGTAVCMEIPVPETADA